MKSRSMVFPTVTGLLTLALIGSSAFAKDENWNTQMAKMAESLAKIMPFIFDEQKFLDPSNTETLKKEVQLLREVSQSLKDKTSEHSAKARTQIGNDPALEYMAREFDGQLELATEALAEGNLRFARLSLRPAISYCISCHTRTSQGPGFPTSPFQTTFNQLSPIDRMSVYTATRQYEPALKVFSEALRDARGSIHQIERATRMALAVSVRVKQSPQDAFRVLDQAATAPGLTKSTEQLIKAWRLSVAQWMAEKEVAPAAAPLERAKDLIKKAEATTTYLADGSGDIHYLRATSILHDLLRTEPPGKTRAEIEFLLGKSYDVMRDLGFWDLHETYYEACIRDAPHTPLAKECFQKHNDSIVIGYSGSSGTHIPVAVGRKVNALRELAEPIASKKGKKK